jgi:hypothetical protein
MNCKAGELARVTSIHPALADAEDRIVRVVEACVVAGEPAWVLEERVCFVATGNFKSLGKSFYIGTPVFFDRLQDKYLRPIRDTDGEDEMLRIAGHPQDQRDPCLLDNINYG